MNKPFSFLKFVVGLTLVWSAGISSAAPLECNTLLDAKVSFDLLNKDFIKANGVAITGEFLYPLDLVLNNLGLSASNVQSDYRNLRVLSLAEGVSGLLPFLLSKGISIKALDLWYHTGNFPNNYSGQLMREYVSKYGEYLIQGDARQVPLSDESVDVVLSHMLVNNVTLVKKKSILREVIRVLKKGGEARIFGFDDEETELIGTFLNNVFSDKVSFDFKEKYYETNFRGNRTPHSMNLLVIKKLGAPSGPH